MAILESIIKTLKKVFKRYGLKSKKRVSHSKKRKKSKTKKKSVKPGLHRFSRKTLPAKSKLKKSLKPNSTKIRPPYKNDSQPGPILGEVTHYFSKIMVIVLKVKRPLRVGQRIRIKGRSSDFSQVIQSLQIESVDVKVAKKGQLVGMKVKKEAKEGDVVYLV